MRILLFKSISKIQNKILFRSVLEIEKLNSKPYFKNTFENSLSKYFEKSIRCTSIVTSLCVFLHLLLKLLKAMENNSIFNKTNVTLHP